MNYGEIMVMATPLLAAIGGVFLAYFIVEGTANIVSMKWTIPRFSRDPRWKNRNQIVDFTAWSIIVFGTFGTAIIGAMTE